MGTFLALGMKPVGAPSWDIESPHVRHLTIGIEDIGTIDASSVEKILPLAPDLIVTLSDDSAIYEQLSKIAPTVVFPYNTFDDTRDEIRTFGEMLVSLMKMDKPFFELPQIETDRTMLRKITEQDAHEIFAYCSDEEVCRYTTWYKHNSVEDALAFILKIMEEYRQGQIASWGIEDKSTGKLIGTGGFVYWNVTHSRAELAYAISRQYWNQGYMTEIVKKMIEFGFAHMNLVRIEARCQRKPSGS
ncbi:GNAT family N-acetyltransferase [Paenibacillus thiaminolyticus]|uniref:GNAT family N-acetyltransferase n=1 Tax=Paenibacillus thiaminolyticus TaxID=49283 RepID=UPI0035A6E696